MKKSVCLAVLNYNGVSHLEQLLPTLEAACQVSPLPASIVVLDNCSTQGDALWIREHHANVRWVPAPSNDFLFSYNWLLEQLEDDVVVLLNNDLRVCPDFLGPLLKHLESDSVFVASACSYDWEGDRISSGPVQLLFEKGFYRWPFDTARQVTCHTLFCSGACMAVDRRKFVELGGFNRLFHPAYCEDLDLCFRAWRRGWRCIYEPRSVVYHREHASWSASGHARIDELALRNALVFQWSSLPLGRLRLERTARIANLIARGLVSADATWLRIWTKTFLFWIMYGRRFRHLKTTDVELRQMMELISRGA